jgi:hypothetical protein
MDVYSGLGRRQMGSVLGLKRSWRETDHFVQRGVKVRSSLNVYCSIACTQTEGQQTFT